MKRVLVVFPTAWDFKQLECCRDAWSARYDIIFAEPGDDACPWDLDIVAYIERTVERYRGRVDGVMSSSDYPGAVVAGVIAERLGLPGTPPEVLLRCTHKYYARLVQQRAVPEATPRFQLVDPRRPPAGLSLELPCFVKPVKGSFSVLARRIESLRQLHEFLSQPAVGEFTSHYLRLFHELVRRYSDFSHDGGQFLAEELLRGGQVTVEGYCRDEEPDVIGVVDSIMHPGTGSFARFDYPSVLPPLVQDRMSGIARRAVRAAGLRDTLFNIEMTYDPETGRIGIIEINPRICGQFGDLYEKVNGANSYLIALALATGQVPSVSQRAGRFRCAASVPLRLFQPARVLNAPSADDIRAVEAEFPGTRVWSECRRGELLGIDLAFEDGQSTRYAVVNVGGDDPDELLRRAAAVESRLGFRFAPVPVGERPAA